MKPTRSSAIYVSLTPANFALALTSRGGITGTMRVHTYKLKGGGK
ncbi:MAG TPA: hypothetical protein VGE74_09665 [Gemmata sp.]